MKKASALVLYSHFSVYIFSVKERTGAERSPTYKTILEALFQIVLTSKI